MAIRRLIILVAALFLLLAASGSAFPSSTYVVRKGDTLSSISKRFHVPAKRIRAENRMRSSNVDAGDKLRIPGKSPAKRSAKAAGKVSGKTAGRSAGKRAGKPAAARGPAQVHVVRPGDTLGSISRRYDVSESELRRLNLMKRSKRLRPGTQIVVRAELPETDTVPERAEDPEPAAAVERPVLAEAPVVSEEELHEAALPVPAAADNAVESTQHRILRVAKKLLKTPYVWGGTSLTGMDCSGYVWKVFAMLNHDLPRSAREQFQVGREVERSNLSIGDLVFFQTYAKYPSHVGIYLGDNRFIHASSGSRQVKISSLDHPYYVKRYIGAKRLLFGENDPVN